VAIKPIIEGVPMIRTTTQPDPSIFVRFILFINNINSASFLIKENELMDPCHM